MGRDGKEPKKINKTFEEFYQDYVESAKKMGIDPLGREWVKLKMSQCEFLPEEPKTNEFGPICP